MKSGEGVAVETTGLSRRWGDFSIRNVSLSIEPGEYYCVLGPTGAGKTLLLELLAGFNRPDDGIIRFDGKDVTDLPPERRDVGFVYQQFMLFPHLNVFDNIAFGMHIRRIPRDEIKERVFKLAGQLGITGILDRDVTSLSGGEQQRISLARALLLRPQLLLLDEPTSSVDPPMREELMDILRQIHRETGVTVIHVTHNRQEAIALANRVTVMNQGAVAQSGKTDEVFRHPESEFVARFLGSENLYRGSAVVDGELTVISVGSTELYAAGKMTGDVVATIRPEDIILAGKRTTTSARNVLEGRVTELADRGTLVRVTLDCGIPLVVLVTHRSYEDMGLTVGGSVYAYVKAQAIHVIKRR
jgi:molybdopterin-binding protein